MIYSIGSGKEVMIMGKAAKIFIGLAVAVVAILVVVGVLVVQNLDTIIKRVIEDVGSDVVGTQVSVGEVKFSLQEGRGEIYGLRIANPPGFTSPSAFEMDEVAVQLEPRSLAGPVIVISEVLIDGARLTAEQRGTTTNLKQLQEGMKPASEEPAPPASDEPGDVRLMLEKFAFVNSAATVDTEQLGDKTLKLPNIRMSDIGDRETGLTPEQLASRMVSTIVSQAQKAVQDYLENAIKDAAKKEAEKRIDEKIGTENREKLESLKGMLKNN
jgi:hypothetical protein